MSAAYFWLVLLYVLALAVSALGTELPLWARLVMLAVGFVGSAIAYDQQFLKPTMRVAHREASIIAGHVFRSLVSEFHSYNPASQSLRVNVMKVRRRWPFRPWKRYLRIDFHRGIYSKTELEQEYDDDVGCCGTSLHENEQIWFDSQRAKTPYRHMTAIQLRVTGHVKSILSTPVYRTKDEQKQTPIAVLNFDSADSVAVTSFDRDRAQELAIKYATVFGLFVA